MLEEYKVYDLASFGEADAADFCPERDFVSVALLECNTKVLGTRDELTIQSVRQTRRCFRVLACSSCTSHICLWVVCICRALVGSFWGGQNTNMDRGFLFRLLQKKLLQNLLQELNG